MKKILVPIVLIATQIGCNESTVKNSANKAVILNSKEIQISNVNNFEIGGVTKTHFIKSDKSVVKVIANSEDLKKFSFTIDSSTFEIKTNDSRENTNIELEIYSENVEQISAAGCKIVIIDDVLNKKNSAISGNGVDNITASINSEKIDFQANGVGHISIDGHVKTGSLTFNGVGNLNLKGFKNDGANVQENGVASFTN